MDTVVSSNSLKAAGGLFRSNSAVLAANVPHLDQCIWFRVGTGQTFVEIWQGQQNTILIPWGIPISTYQAGTLVEVFNMT
jgi:hypothetical protein